MITNRPTPPGLAPLDLTNEPTQVNRDLVDSKHPDYDLNHSVWFNSAVMYEGGALIKKHSDKFVLRRPKEDPTVYQHRLDLFNYENNFGTGLGWYQAEMFSGEVKIDIRTKDKNGNPNTKSELPPDADKFYNQRFLKNCNNRGTTYLDFAEELFKQLLLFRECYVLVDRKPTIDTGVTLQQQRESGDYDPYLCVYSPIDVINWDLDQYGNLNWVMIYQVNTTQQPLQKPQTVERWTLYTRQRFWIYECKGERNTSTQRVSDQDKTVDLIDTGYHALAKHNIVPLYRAELPEGWWLGNRAYLPAMEHIDTSNVLRWSLRMAGLAVPVVISDDDVSTLSQSEYMFIKLSEGSKYEWSEPEGRSWQHLAARLETLKEEIWRCMYLVAQARSTSATASAQSGVSKQQDMQPSHDVLDGMGGVLRAALQGLLELVIKARGDDQTLVPDVRGFNFEDKLTAAELDVIESAFTLGVPSKTFEKELDKHTAQTVLKDAPPEVMQAIFDEIDASPTRAELAQQQQEQQLQMRVKAMQEGVAGSTKDPVSQNESD